MLAAIGSLSVLGLILGAVLGLASRYLRVEGRMFELCNTVRFTVKAFEGEFALDPAIRPDNNDWAITGKGTVIARLTWVRLVWTAEAEAGILAFANKVGEWLKECCGDLSPATAD